MDGQDVTPREWISDKFKCKKCGSNLKMYEYGDYGLCTNHKTPIIWVMFRGESLIGQNVHPERTGSS